MPVAAALAALFVLLALGGADPQGLHGLGLLVLAAMALGVVWDIMFLVLRRRRPTGRVVPRRVPPRIGPTILVDGSNVMHWNGDPSAKVLARVVQNLLERGERPHVYFDANAGYKLADRYLGPAALGAMIGLPGQNVTVADSGCPADPLLLDHASRSRLRIVSNDRFRDWCQQFPGATRHGALVKGRWREGTPLLQL
ncbi:NYN domain-containing protein [Loktanella sp. DJP18]|uniref:NYN domain-containing protein n=1 Tax=Loktanella sp. DJP18 TaxID=3409788 RepID=UPI003BB6F9FC